VEITNKILVTGSTGMVGSSLTKLLRNKGYKNILAPSHSELDLRRQNDVEEFFATHKPDYVFHLAAIVGGIKANNEYPAKFIYDNTGMHLNVIKSANDNNVKKVLFPGSACTYPKNAQQPIKEESFLSGYLEPTNIAYAAAKINGIISAQSYRKQHNLNVIIPMPTNAYGEGDHFDIENCHVIPALIRRFHEAKTNSLDNVEIWGSGNVYREFLYVDDFADSLLFLMQNYNSEQIINIGTMDEISIKDLALKIAKITGYNGQIKFDTSKPDGMKRKCLDSQRINNLGWKAKTNFDQGLEKTYKYFLENIA
jgi:GDP-L-fucose synthase